MDDLEHQLFGLRPRRVLLRNPDEMEAAFAELGMECQRLSRAQGEGWTATAQLGQLGFRATSSAGRDRVKGEVPAGRMLMQIDMGSNGPRRVGGHAIGRDEIGIILGGAEFDVVTAEQHRAVLFSLPESFVLDAAGHRAPGVGSLIFANPILLLAGCPAHVTRIRAFAKAAFGSGDQPFGLHAPEFAHGDMVDTLIDALLAPWNREAAARPRVPHYQRLPIVRRVEEYMRSNLSEPITLRDLCNVARASQRAMEYAFRDVYGVGPKQYLRLLRLNQVRRELKAVPSEVATVTDIAHRFGFWHMGHFSTRYRRLFGETPRQGRGHGQRQPSDPTPAGTAVPSPALGAMTSVVRGIERHGN